MEKTREELVKRALGAGILLTPDLLETLDENKLDQMIAEAKQKDKSVLTDREKPTKSKLVIKVSRVVPRERLVPEDFVKYYNNKYDGIRKILLKRVDAVSINKVRESYDEVSVIGMVRELMPNGFMIEDPTGEIGVVSDDKPDVDDVIGVKGTVREKKIIANEIILPDIPLTNQLNKINNISILLTTSLTGKARNLSQSTNFTLIPSTGSESLDEKEKQRVITNFTNPTWVKISTMGNEMNILVYRPDDDMEQKQAIDYLRKRHLSPERNKIISPDDCFFLQTIPDIFWLISPKKFLENYKGVTIVSCEAPDVALANLGTREVEFKQI